MSPGAQTAFQTIRQHIRSPLCHYALVVGADEAMERAKQHGRNRFVTIEGNPEL